MLENCLENNIFQSGIPQTKKTTSHYKNGIKNGLKKEWDEDGNITFQRNFVEENKIYNNGAQLEVFYIILSRDIRSFVFVYNFTRIIQVKTTKCYTKENRYIEQIPFTRIRD